jgi:hypothetical protein
MHRSFRSRIGTNLPALGVLQKITWSLAAKTRLGAGVVIIMGIS